jgi:hypothetical protein
VRVEVTPHEAEIHPGLPVTFRITIVNTSTIIGGYTVRLLGADPSWVELDEDRISLFPDESITVTATVTAPRGLAAGVRRIAVHVRELTPPHGNTIDEIDLRVPEASAVDVRLDPIIVTAGKKATYSVLVENTGNTMLRSRPAGEDPEGKVTFRFVPDMLRLGPGEHAVLDLQLKARRHFLGSPTPRTFNLYLDEVPEETFFATPPGQEEAEPQAATRREDANAVATGTFLQRAVMARGSISAMGLLLTISVFAVVITLALSRLVGQSAADRNLVLQIAAARNSNGTSGTAGVSGSVHSLTTGKALQGVAVDVFSATDTSTPIATTATDGGGNYQVTNLAAGAYKIEYRGAGLLDTWYPAATTSADAAKVNLTTGRLQSGLDVKLSGTAASITGTVTGDDVSGATLFLETLPAQGATRSTVQTTPIANGTNTPPDNGLAVVESVPIGSDGTFSLGNVPSPATFTIVVVKPGYAQSRIQIDVGAGENRTGVGISLNKGDGEIAGTVTSASAPLDNVTITATTGQTAVNTVSLTGANIGTFALLQLPTPATYTVVASKAGFASQTLTVTLTAGQKLTGLAITLSSSSGTLAGSVTVTTPNEPDVAGAGVAVTVTNGVLSVQTETDSTKHPGQWEIGGLPIPGTYTVTFSRPDLATQIVSVSLDNTGRITPGSQGATVTPNGTVAVVMKSSTAVVAGTVVQPGGATVCGSNNELGEASITLASGTSTYSVTTASLPASLCGQYRIENVPPGTYTLTATASGTTPAARTIVLAAGQHATGQNFTLKQPASLSGTVQDSTGANLCNWTVDLYLQAQYPTTRLATTSTAAPNGSSCSGAFSFHGIPAGTFIVAVGAVPGNPTATTTVVVKPSDNKTITVKVGS